MGGRVVLGVTGSIAAFKAAKLASDLVAGDFQVRVILTAGGEHFVTPLTFEAITGNPVVRDVWDEEPGGTRMGHLELARWADLIVVAPASASALARLAIGLADDMLSAVALAAVCPLLIAPAMESNMWAHPATQSNMDALVDRGAAVVGPEAGRLASGAVGPGRMTEPEGIRVAIEDALAVRRQLVGRTVLVTAGPTYEPIDPVRFIGNRSSGKMGYAVAREARDRGATVVLVAGPTSLPDPAGMEVIHVETHAHMRDEVLARVRRCDVAVMAAAVADFRPSERAREKLKRRGTISLELTPNSDIAAEAAEANPGAIHVGFALESEDLIDRARDKLTRKGQDLVVANAISPEHNPFGSDSNQVVLVTRDDVESLPPASKAKVARVLWDRVVDLLAEPK